MGLLLEFELTLPPPPPFAERMISEDKFYI